MEDVVVHYRSGSADRLGSLIERTEKLLEPFPCRTPPVFRPWFSTAGHRLPIRPTKPAPVITSNDLIISDGRSHPDTKSVPENSRQKPRVCGFAAEKRHDHSHKETARGPTAKTQEGKEKRVTRLSPPKLPQGDTDCVTDSPIKRSWSVSTQRGVLQWSCQSMSKQFHHMVSVHGLHLRQRAKWVIGEDNCGMTQDMEQVWLTLSRLVRSAQLPTCNANIQREWAEIWVFCDVIYSEQVGWFLKDKLRLLGRISLSVHGAGNIFSM
ncbi:shieldin complex subunit 3 [Echeneis naucrates]|uniref:shieldin complex subunit 3 n=1 Tax=Echeneis naucrates TaxID=173247 RepID=UPI0011133B1B|nr:shieldin complex subunit 3-like [Echeneis naucrates]